jgi:hypothetical protein
VTTRRILTIGLALAATAVTLLPVCNLIFACGCTWPWLGGVSHCNIYHPVPPHCPACQSWPVSVILGSGVVAGWMLLFGLVVALVPRRRRSPER